MTETPHYISVLKAISWRIVGTLDTMLITWLITGKPVFAIKVGLVELLTKITLYYLHERAWAFGLERVFKGKKDGMDNQGGVSTHESTGS